MKTLRSIFSGLLIFGATVVYSAPAPPPSTTGGTTGGASSPACWPPPCVPVDNGVIFLIVAGALYGAKKIYDSHKNAQTIS